MALPAFLFPVHLRFPRPVLHDLQNEVYIQFKPLRSRLLQKSQIGITAGSRGIRNIGPILAGVVRWLKENGHAPVLVAAMGSHGGATTQGQLKLLSHFGISQESIGAPILGEMGTTSLGHSVTGLTAFCSRVVHDIDQIIVVNRVKPHTAFASPFGSGLLKMLAVGLGKVEGAAQIHRQGPAKMAQAIEEIAKVFLATGKVLGGLAIIENAYDETAEIVWVNPDDMIERERELFQKAKSLMPKLPVEDIDLLIVDEMGKNYSGTGMDVNVIGRWRLPGMPEPPSPRIKRIVTLRLSPESEGNAQGVGLADVVTRRLVDAIDPVNTYTNTITSTFLERGFIPITMPTDREAIGAALASLALSDPAKARIVRIRNTLHLSEIWVSETLLPELANRSDVTIGAAEPLQFTDDGMLVGVAN